MRYLLVAAVLVGMGMAGYEEILKYQKPEPMDVPAIKEKRPDPNAGVRCGGGSGGSDGLINGSCITKPRDATIEVMTCEDKSRILLTAEDGSKHCISFKGNR